MRLTVTLCLLLAVLFCMAQQTIKKPALSIHAATSAVIKCKLPDDNNPDTPQTRIKCVDTEPPLYVIDGRLAEADEIKKIDPSTIASVDVLKDAAAATVYCNRNTRGVVLITTKKKPGVQFVIKDAQDKKPLPGATVQLGLSEDKYMKAFTAGEDGIVNVTGLIEGRVYELNTSWVSCMPMSMRYKYVPNQAPQEILLERNEQSGPEVVVVSYPTTRCRCLTRCGSSRVIQQITRGEAEPAEKQFIVYPNPSVRGNSLTIDINTAEQQAAIIRIHGRDGKLVWEQSVQTVKGPNRFTVNTDASWAAGVYFLQVVSRGAPSTSLGTARNAMLLIQ